MVCFGILRNYCQRQANRIIHKLANSTNADKSKHILALNNQVTLIQNGVSVAELTQLGTADNRVILRMADKTRQDSRTMRIATVVAIVYLPANLVMV